MSSVTYSVGMQCEAIWAEDGKLYPAEVLSVFTRKGVELCRVKYQDYDEEAEVPASDLKPLAKPQRSPKPANGKAVSPAPRQQAASASPFSSATVKPEAGQTPKTPGAKTPGAKTPQASPAAAAELGVELKQLQAELRAKQDEDAREKEAALHEMKVLADKLLMEGYARQAALADLKAREDRVKHQLALLSKSFLSFSSQSPSSSAHAGAADDADGDVSRCIDGIKRLQVRNHAGANEAVLISQLGLAINPKVEGLKQFLATHPQHFDVIVNEVSSPKGKSTVFSVKLK